MVPLFFATHYGGTGVSPHKKWGETHVPRHGAQNVASDRVTLRAFLVIAGVPASASIVGVSSLPGCPLLFSNPSCSDLLRRLSSEAKLMSPHASSGLPNYQHSVLHWAVMIQNVVITPVCHTATRSSSPPFILSTCKTDSLLCASSTILFFVPCPVSSSCSLRPTLLMAPIFRAVSASHSSCFFPDRIFWLSPIISVWLPDRSPI